MVDICKVNQKRASFYQNIFVADLLTLYTCNWIHKITHCQERNPIMIFCYRDNDMSTGKRECHRKMLVELKTLIPKGRCEKVDRQLVGSIIGLKHRNGTGYRLDQSISRWTSQTSMEKIWKTYCILMIYEDLIDMSSLSRSNSGYKCLLNVIDVFNKYGWTVPLKTKTDKEVTMHFINCSLLIQLLVICGWIRALDSTTSSSRQY